MEASSRADLQRAAIDLLDRFAPRWREFTEWPSQFDLRTSEFLLLVGRLGQPRYRRVLEVGCGAGYSLLLWSLIADEVVGVDVPGSLEVPRRLLRAAARQNVQLVEATGEDLSPVMGKFDLIVTQYVLEHVSDIGATLREIQGKLGADGVAVHVLPSLVDRHDWWMTYRRTNHLVRRVWHSIRDLGLPRGLLEALRHTPAHSPDFGDFAQELDGYRLESWALHIMRSGSAVLDTFQTRDVNWVIVCRPLPPSLTE